MISIPQNSYDVILGENITIACDISSHPPPTKVSWQRKVTGTFTPITIDGGRFSGSSVENSSLTISFVTFEDDGEYICVVDNFVGEGRSNLTILFVIGGKPRDKLHIKLIQLFTLKGTLATRNIKNLIYYCFLLNH